MMNKDFDGSNGLYAWANPCNKSVIKLANISALLGFESRIGRYHSTIMYSRDNPEHTDVPKVNPVCNAIVRGVGHWEEGGSHYCFLRLESNDLTAAHNLIRDSMGVTFTFPSYEPHITLHRQDEPFSADQLAIFDYLSGLVKGTEIIFDSNGIANLDET